MRLPMADMSESNACSPSWPARPWTLLHATRSYRLLGDGRNAV